jgi:hypothetical protein
LWDGEGRELRHNMDAGASVGNLRVPGAQPHLTWDICTCTDAGSDLVNVQVPAGMSIYIVFPHKQIHTLGYNTGSVMVPAGMGVQFP